MNFFGKKKDAAKQGGPPGSQWSQDDVSQFLQSLELGQYAALFKKNKIDGIALLQLKEDDIMDLGVGVIADRKKLVSAIETLNFRLGVGPPPAHLQQQQQQKQPLPTIGLIARNVNGVVKVFDTDTGEEIVDIAAHQEKKYAELREKQMQEGGNLQGLPPGGAPPPIHQTPLPGSMPPQSPPMGGSDGQPPPRPHPSSKKLLEDPSSLAGESDDSALPHPSRPADPRPPYSMPSRQQGDNPPSRPQSFSANRFDDDLDEDDMPASKPVKTGPSVAPFIDEDARDSPFFVAGTNSAQAAYGLRGQPAGSYLFFHHVQEDSLTLFMAPNSPFTSMPIIPSETGLRLEASQKNFSALSSLVQYYTFENPEYPSLLRPLGSTAEPTSPTVASPPPRPAPSASPPKASVPQHWYQRNMSKEEVMALLEPQPHGTFFVRDSKSEPGCYALTYAYKGTTLHKLIETTPGGLRFKQSEHLFPTIDALLSYYQAESSGDLKCKLVSPPDPEILRASLKEKKASSAPPPPSTGASWNCMSMDRDAALAKLNNAPNGAFIIRPSDKSYAALSMVTPTGLYHMHIESGPEGLRLKKQGTPSFPDLNAFIDNYTRPSKDLPCPLILR